jgi:hypothetical protein
MIMHLCQSVAASAQDRFWHECDLRAAPTNVRKWGVERTQRGRRLWVGDDSKRSFEASPRLAYRP